MEKVTFLWSFLVILAFLEENNPELFDICVLQIYMLDIGFFKFSEATLVT